MRHCVQKYPFHAKVRGEFCLDNGRDPKPGRYVTGVGVVYEEVEDTESDDAKRRRTAAEKRVMKVVLYMGERVTHGDLLTFQKFNQARALRSNSVRAVDRSAIALEIRYLKQKTFTLLHPCKNHVFF